MSRLHRVGGNGSSARGAVVFVHGLGGDPWSTWRHGPDEAGFWPAWLAQDFPDLDVHTLRYPANASAWQGTAMALPDRATNVLAEFVAERLDGRQLVFVCHSLGGLVVKQVLRVAADQPGTTWNRLLHQTRGVVFIATPNAGSDLATFLDRQPGLRPTAVVNDLKAHSAYVRDLNFWYREAAPRCDIGTLAFVESERTSGFTVVDATSGDPSIPGVRPIPLDADHLTICKPVSRDETLYKSVGRFVEERLPSASATNGTSGPESRAAAYRPVHGPESLPELSTLPARLGDFTGREPELEAVRDALDARSRAKIAVLSGMPGSGKTTIAVEAAYRNAGEFPDGLLYVDLRGFSRGVEPLSVDAAASAIIRQLQPTATLADEADQRLAQYRRLLAGKRRLIVFDNARDTGQLRDLVPPDPAGLLVTSRRSVTLPGARPVPVGVLPVEPARDLLRTLVGEVGTDDELDQVARRCGHLPLALRAAGMFLQVYRWPIAKYVAALGEARLTMLSRIGTDEDDPAHDVRAVIGLSLEQLQREDAVLLERFRLLSVFPTTFQADAAAAVWRIDHAETRRALDRLNARSLVQPDRGSGRYLLHDLLHDLAMEELDATKLDEAAGSHSAHYRGVLREIGRLFVEVGQHLAALALFDIEWPNIEAGQAWAAAHLSERDDAAHVASRYMGAGEPVLSLRLPPRQRLPWYKAGLEACMKIGEPDCVSSALNNLGICLYDMGDLSQSERIYEQLYAIANKSNKLEWKCYSLNGLGTIHLANNKYVKAIQHLDLGLTFLQRIERKRSSGNMMRLEGSFNGNLGDVYISLGRPQRALSYYRRHLTIAREIEDPGQESAALRGIGRAYLDMNEPEQASEHFWQSVKVARSINDLRSECVSLDYIGMNWSSIDPARAIICYDDALTIACENDFNLGAAAILYHRAEALEMAGRTLEAVENARAALSAYQQLGHPDAAKVKEWLRRRGIGLIEGPDES